MPEVGGLSPTKIVLGQRYPCTNAKKSLEPKGNTPEALTERAQTILLQMAQGKANKQVAMEHGVLQGTGVRVEAGGVRQA
jgi:DNA-binding NarL/FixJ family response regulator